MGDRKGLSPQRVLELLPQKPPFRFLDEIVEMDPEHIVGRYTFRGDEFFYTGHFPEDPVTPGVILLETMAQVGVVAWGLFLASLDISGDEIANYRTLFTDGEVEFFEIVRPGTRVTCLAKKLVWRSLKLRSKVDMYRDDGKLVASCTVAGCGVLCE